ncbi:MAG: hypothetical protein UT61_C0004G0064 [Candidatus Woesebacteria bacterium GW2011_GWA1_39_8]|uniref:Uncharacterized protein n=2 Tax=Candidatus Woeseibacteriota TaxID=1752722 RepID=A0A0G0SYI3_9BACT|nr:MAG: hypothetical protein UT61_C0004G0064 [Candidatus Woesebacteria bacterium GW2011_GWA1_39_8]
MMKVPAMVRRIWKGTITPALLVITGAFLVVLYGILFVLSLQFDYSNRQVGGEQALHVAEAGVNYYRWHLAHDPDDFTDGTGQAGPYEHEYYDPQGNAVGKYSLTISPPEEGSSIVTIKSNGWTYQYPKIKRAVTVQYGIPSFARYSFLSNSSSWYGSGITVNGLVHSNNGIRMDGTNTSLVTSAQETYMCGSETGCSPPQQRPGVWGSGGDQGLWQYPVTAVDFDEISLDLTNMRDAAQTEGLYLGPSTKSGYHIIFSSNGTFTLKRVNSTNYIRGYSTPGQGIGAEGQGGCRRLYQLITGETTLGTYNVSDTPIVFAEDDLWVEGAIRGRITVVSASFPIQSSQRDIWIRNNLTYTAYDGSDVLGLVSQDNIFFIRDVPNDFKIDAVLMAQKGKIIRHGYYSSCSGTSSGAVKNSLTINGALINYYKSYWNFVSGSTLVSGFTTRTINYDTNLLYAPPPYFPTSGEYEFISWREER